MTSATSAAGSSSTWRRDRTASQSPFGLVAEGADPASALLLAGIALVAGAVALTASSATLLGLAATGTALLALRRPHLLATAHQPFPLENSGPSLGHASRTRPFGRAHRLRTPSLPASTPPTAPTAQARGQPPRRSSWSTTTRWSASWYAPASRRKEWRSRRQVPPTRHWNCSADLPDLVVSDVNKPGLDGFEFVSQLRREPAAQSLPLMFRTSRSDASDVVTGLRLGADDYVSKPFDLTELVARVQAKLSRPPVPADQRAVDPRTGLLPQPRFLEEATREVDRAASTRRAGAVAVVDISPSDSRAPTAAGPSRVDRTGAPASWRPFDRPADRS